MEARFRVRVSRLMTRMVLGFCAALLVCSVGCSSLCPRAEKQCTAVGARAEISPFLTWVALGSEAQFAVKIAGEPAEPVRWLVNGVVGGNEIFGTIAGGVYHSPAVAPVPNELHIEAKLAEGGRSLFSTVIVGRHDPAYRLVDRWEMGDRTEGRLEEPHGICLDPSGNVLVTDSALGLVCRYTPGGKFLDEIGGGKGTGPGFFDGPRDVKVDSRGRVYVSDGDSNTLQRFDPGGKVIMGKTITDRNKTDIGHPHALDLDASGRVYVADVNHGRVVVFDEDCRFLMAWPTPPGGPENKAVPHGVGVDPNGDILVCDYSNRCYKYTSSGELLFSFAETDRRYHAICTDRWGDIYIAARNKLDTHAFITKYNNNGVHVATFDIPREGEAYPHCLAVDADGNIYVTDKNGVDILAPTSAEGVTGELVVPKE